ncbi:cytochrome P450 89A2-like [Rutidosis leptorrhynchoides]|uniref:cytochrome P450 89A2-like n=1 Tax=Rutidosis leptorrhynchoides TaxID=125765 RepID=UPI003A997871
MELWFIILISISISLLLKATINLFSPSGNLLPPGPRTFPIIGTFLWLRIPPIKIKAILRSLHSKLGPIITLQIGARPTIFISDRSLVHKVLVQNGAVFADRPSATTTVKVSTCNQHNINSSSYGPTWRALRRNLTEQILHPCRVKNYSHARKWVLDILLDSFKLNLSTGEPVSVMDNFQYAMFCLLLLMCFGDKLDKKQIKEIEFIHQKNLLNFHRFNVLNFWPRLMKILMRWQEFHELNQETENVLLPLIRARKESRNSDSNDEHVSSYVDSLLELELPEENNPKLHEREIVALCSEFLSAGTDTTSTAVQWIMANLVKNQETQDKLFTEIKSVVVDDEEEVKEEVLPKMPYLKAIALEGLRRHPPGHFLLPHAVTKDFVLNGHVLPKNATTNFVVAEMGWDPKVWDNPMEFKPERFLKDNKVFDITGSREIKMMPFGVGRRICPARGLAMLHLEYFVANLIWNFKWEAVHGDEISLEEKEAFTVVMKHPLMARISPRFVIHQPQS